VPARLPDDRRAYHEIAVHHLVPHSRKLFPGNIRVAIDNLLRDLLDSFSYHHKIENDCLAGLPVGEQLLVRHVLGIGLDRGDCIVNIREVEFHLPLRHR